MILEGTWTVGNCHEGKGIIAHCVHNCIRKILALLRSDIHTHLSLPLHTGRHLGEADVLMLVLRSCLQFQNPAGKTSSLESLGPTSASQQNRKQSAEGHWEEQRQEKVPGCVWAVW